jgi:hypothetical protein
MPDETKTPEPSHERCARCGLDVRAWKVHGDDDAIYCTSYCARLAGAAFVAVEVTPEPPTEAT